MYRRKDIGREARKLRSPFRIGVVIRVQIIAVFAWKSPLRQGTAAFPRVSGGAKLEEETGGNWGNWTPTYFGKDLEHLLREGPGAPTSGRTWRTWKRAGEGGHPPPTYFGKELENLEKSRGNWGNWTPTYFGKKLENLESVGTYLPRG